MKSVSLFSNKLVIYLTSFICGMIFVLLSLFAMIKLFYPVCYLEKVKEYAKEYGIETSLVLAIINTESGFNRFAFSNKGAVGLMQIVPSTASFIAEDLGFLEFEWNQLYDADTNIRFGCYYLHYLKNKFNSVEEVLFAYNAGEGRLQTFLRENNGKFDLKNIEINETRNYIKKVNRAIVFYKKWYKI